MFIQLDILSIGDSLRGVPEPRPVMFLADRDASNRARKVRCQCAYASSVRSCVSRRRSAPDRENQRFSKQSHRLAPAPPHNPAFASAHRCILRRASEFVHERSPVQDSLHQHFARLRGGRPARKRRPRRRRAQHVAIGDQPPPEQSGGRARRDALRAFGPRESR